MRENVECFESLYWKYAKKVYSISSYILRDNKIAEDITQEVFITLHTKLNQLKDYNCLEAWIRKVTVNLCFKYLKKRKNYITLEKMSVYEEESLEAIDTLLEETIIHKELRRELINIINDLYEPQRLCIILFYYFGYSIKEIARMLRCNEGTIKSRMFNAKKYIHERMVEK